MITSQDANFGRESQREKPKKEAATLEIDELRSMFEGGDFRSSDFPINQREQVLANIKKGMK